MTESGKGADQAALTELAGLLMATSSFEDLMQAVADLTALLGGRVLRPAVIPHRRPSQPLPDQIGAT